MTSNDVFKKDDEQFDDVMEDDNDDKVLSHQDAMQLFKDSLAEIIVVSFVLNILHCIRRCASAVTFIIVVIIGWSMSLFTKNIG